MNAQEKWLKANDILNSNPSESELKDAVKLVQEAISDGHAGAYFTMSQLYYMGYGVEQDKKKNYELLCKSLELGYERAKVMLARCYVEGEVVEKDLAKAEQYLREMAEKDDKDACAELAGYIIQEVFPDSTHEEGLMFLEKAAKLGHIYSMGNLGGAYGKLCQDEKANYWFTKAKEAGLQGVEEAQSQYSSETYPQRRVNLIYYYISRKEYLKVFELLERDINNGDQSALYIQAELLMKGMGEERYGQDISRAVSIYESLSEKGDSNADYYLGEAYLKGPLEENVEKGIYYYTKSAEAGNADAQYVLGEIYRRPMNNIGNKEMAAHWIELAANQDQRDALCVMAYSYLQDPEIHTMNINNLSYDQDVEKGMYYLRRAVELGSANALYVLAICYQIGKYVEKDVAKAFELLQKSVHFSSTPESVNKLGDFYRDGIGTEQNYESAAQCYTWAANNGDTGAMLSLSILYREGKGVEKNEKLADELHDKWLETIHWNVFGKMPLDVAREQAQQGIDEAMYQLGNRYDNGDGVEQNAEVASDWWLKAAMKGHIEAAHNLGNYYFYKKHDVENGLRWLEKAASDNSTLSLYALGDIYINGLGIVQDVEKGLAYINKAADLDYPEAKRKLSFLYHDGDIVEQDIDKSKYWLEKYLESDLPDAHLRMGYCLYHGDMYEINYTKALDHFTEAVKGRCHDASPYYIDMLWRGNHATQDRETVLSTYKELAERGDAIASYYLYTLYNDEEYVSRDKEAAITYLKKSAEKGYPVALRYMAFQYMEGGLFETDFNKANEYLSQASEGGDTIAMVNLATSYQSGRAVEKDVKKALELFVSAAEAGESYAACEAAKILLIGEEGVVDVDYDKAIEILQRPANEGDLESYFLLAYTLTTKCDLEEKYSWQLAQTAFHYMLKAANAGHPEAMYLVAYAYMEGRGVLRDMKQARQWFEKAKTQKHRIEEIDDIFNKFFSDYQPAQSYPFFVYCHNIVVHNPSKIKDKEQYIDDQGYMNQSAVARGAAQCGEVNAAVLVGFSLIDSDPDKAWEYFDIAIGNGYTLFAEEVGRIYYNGDNVKQDFDRAEKYFAYGSDLGDIRCTLSLGLMYTAEGVSKETEEKGKQLLMSVCEASDEGSDVYNYAKAQLERIEQRETPSMSKLSKGFRSLFSKKKNS